ncbi:response regulator (plasmid) [Arthrobacter sp. D3-18]
MTSRGKCLVIEDDEDIAGLIEAILTAADFDVRVETTGTEGLLAAASAELTLITLDLGLPDMDGREVAGLLRDVSKAPILMITAFAGVGDELDGFSAGATAYLPKPFRPTQLRNLVDQLCPREVRLARPVTS